MRRTIAFLTLAAILSGCGDDVLTESTPVPPPSTATTAAPTSTQPPSTTTTAAPTTTTTAAPTTTTTAAPTTTTTAAPTTTTTLPWGPAAPDCINGWITPEPGSELWNTGLGYLGVGPNGVVIAAGDFVVDEMRYFVGPEDADIIAPRRDVERWYIKGYATIEPAYRSRWLARRVDVGAGLAWVADYGSTGWGAGTWIACYDPERTNNYYTDFCLPGAEFDPFPLPCFGFAPGAWSPGDCFGLPPEVLGCVAGT